MLPPAEAEGVSVPTAVAGASDAPVSSTTAGGGRAEERNAPQIHEETRAAGGRVARVPSDREMYPPDATFYKVLEFIHQGRNLFITGGAGVGKSYLLHQLRNHFKKELHVTSTTGISALNVRGQTIHSWAGVGICNRPIDRVVASIRRNNTLYAALRRCSMLAIDEISMLGDYTLDYVSGVLQRIRGDMRPFGGIQVLIFGDFFQLPPVIKEGGLDKTFCFHSRTWNEWNLLPIILKKIKRQSDTDLARALNNIRAGNLFPEDVDIFRSREVPPYEEAPKDVLQIFGLKADAEALNLKRLLELPEPSFVFEAEDKFYRYGLGGKCEVINITRDGTNSLDDRERRFYEKFDDDCRAPRRLELRLHCRVILLVNIDVTGGLVNGTCGTVTKISKNGIEVRFDGHAEPRLMQTHCFDALRGEDPIITRAQYPLRLAYGLTIHKSQGMTFDKLVVNLNKIFSCGQAYVALSRTRTKEGLFIRSFDEKKIAASEDVIDFYRQLEKIGYVID